MSVASCVASWVIPKDLAGKVGQAGWVGGGAWNFPARNLPTISLINTETERAVASCRENHGLEALKPMQIFWGWGEGPLLWKGQGGIISCPVKGAVTDCSSEGHGA